MANNWDEALAELKLVLAAHVNDIVEEVRQADIGGSPLAMVLNTIAVDRGHDVQETYRFVRGSDPNIDTLSVLLDGLSNLRRENADIIARLDELTAKPE